MGVLSGKVVMFLRVFVMKSFMILDEVLVVKMWLLGWKVYVVSVGKLVRNGKE